MNKIDSFYMLIFLGLMMCMFLLFKKSKQEQLAFEKYKQEQRLKLKEILETDSINNAIELEYRSEIDKKIIKIRQSQDSLSSVFIVFRRKDARLSREIKVLNDLIGELPVF